MFRIAHFEIEGFWGRLSASADLAPDVNIFIGRNGSGKTTLINILQAVLEVDLRLLTALDFEVVVLKLQDGKRRRTVRVTKHDDPDLPFESVTFKIARLTFTLPLYSREIDGERYLAHRPSARAELGELRQTMDSLVNTSSISVHRETRRLADPEDEYTIRSRQSRRGRSRAPIDVRLQELIAGLTEYQLSLAAEAGRVSTKLQHDVLASMLFSSKFDSFSPKNAESLESEGLRENLGRAYQELGLGDQKTQRRIDEHIKALEVSIEALRKFHSGESVTIEKILPLPLLRRTQYIANLSLTAQSRKQEVFRPIERFVEVVQEFFKDKSIAIDDRGTVSFAVAGKSIAIDQLSSGEKQILVFLVEALLQRERPFVFIADEPELSLHIEWQAKIVTSLRRLNPESQVILATHSPEIAGDFHSRVIDMESIVS